MEQPYHADLDQLSAEELRDLKDYRLRYTVEHAYEESPFYREVMDKAGVSPDDINGVDDIDKLPIVSSQDIRDNQPPAVAEHRFRNDDADVRRRFHTSGTTGAPKVVYKSYDEVDRIYDDVRRGHEHFGLTGDETVVDYFPMVGLNMSGFGTEGGMAELGVETIPIHDTPYPAEKEAQILDSEEPDVITGLASHIDSKGMAFREEGYDPAAWGVDSVIVAGEPVTDTRKEHIGDIYDADVYEYLGSTEAGAFAYECVDGPGLHVLGDSIHVEVVDPETEEQLPAGEEGSLVVTNLLHPGEESAMPFIRYRIGDLVTTYDADGGCDCVIGGGKRITAPKREGGSFIVGAVNLDPLFFEETIYDHDDLESTITDYQLQLGYEEETGQDVLDVVIESNDEQYVGQTAEQVSQDMEVETAADEIGQMLLDRNAHLNNTVDTADAVQVNVTVTDAVDVGQGKPERVVDTR